MNEKRIDNIDDFLSQLTKRYGSPKNVEVDEDIRRYFSGIKTVDFEKLYCSLVENHDAEYYPNLAKIKKLFDGSSAGMIHNRKDSEALTMSQQFVDMQSQHPWRIILETHKEIVKKIVSGDEIRSFEVDFMAKWDTLAYVFGKLKDMKKDDAFIARHCEVVRDKINKGEQINYMALRSINVPDIHVAKRI